MRVLGRLPKPRARVHIRTVEILLNKSPANESSVVPDFEPPDCLGQRFDG